MRDVSNNFARYCRNVVAYLILHHDLYIWSLWFSPCSVSRTNIVIIRFAIRSFRLHPHFPVEIKTWNVCLLLRLLRWLLLPWNLQYILLITVLLYIYIYNFFFYKYSACTSLYIFRMSQNTFFSSTFMYYKTLIK